MRIKKIISIFQRPAMVVGLLVTLLFCSLYFGLGSRSPWFLTAIDHKIMDMMFRIRGPVADTGRVTIVDIDEKSLGQLGQWPWPRHILAQITQNLTKAGVAAMGFDILFAEPDRSSPVRYFTRLGPKTLGQIPKEVITSLMENPDMDYDALFGEALSQGPSVLGYAFQTIDDGLKKEAELPFASARIQIKPREYGFGHLALIPAYRAVVNDPGMAMAESEGFFNVFSDDGGTTRQVPLIMTMDGIPYPSLALETYRLGVKAQEITLHLSRQIKYRYPPMLGLQIQNRFYPTDELAQLFVNYRGPARTFDYVSASDVLHHPETLNLKDRFILIGASAKGLYDLRTTPFSPAIPGVEINASIIDNLIAKDPFRYDRLSEVGLTYTLVAAGGAILSVTLALLGPMAGALLALGLIASAALLNFQIFFLNQVYVGLAFPLMAWLTLLLSATIFNAVRERKTRRYIKKAFSHYLSKEVVTELIANPKSLSLTGQEKELTVLFCDIRGFTTLSETLPPGDLGQLMNTYLTRMSRVILKNKGTLDKFIGDAIMAFWGAPRPDEDHAGRAVATALEMIQESHALSKELKAAGLPEIRMGIGINTGLMSVGNFGSQERFDYTVMGDHVNLASRLEGANKNYGTGILISDATRERVHKNTFCRYIDRVQVKGRSTPVDIYEPLTQGEPHPELADRVIAFEEAVAVYQQGDFTAAKKLFTPLHRAHPSQLTAAYLDRIKAFSAHPPPPEWQGAERRAAFPVSKLTTK